MSLCSHDYTAAEKAAAVTGLKRKTDGHYDGLLMKIANLKGTLDQLERSLDMQYRIIEDCKKHHNTFARIPEYVGLRDEINREFEKRNIKAKARFACEYVIGLKDEKWRDAIEAFLGPAQVYDTGGAAVL